MDGIDHTSFALYRIVCPQCFPCGLAHVYHRYGIEDVHDFSTHTSRYFVSEAATTASSLANSLIEQDTGVWCDDKKSAHDAWAALHRARGVMINPPPAPLPPFVNPFVGKTFKDPRPAGAWLELVPDTIEPLHVNTKMSIKQANKNGYNAYWYHDELRVQCDVQRPFPYNYPPAQLGGWDTPKWAWKLRGEDLGLCTYVYTRKVKGGCLGWW